MKTQKDHWRKKKLPKSKLGGQTLSQILNGQASNNQAYKKYDVPRTTITYWLRKNRTVVQQNIGMSKTMKLKS